MSIQVGVNTKVCYRPFVEINTCPKCGESMDSGIGMVRVSTDRKYVEVRAYRCANGHTHAKSIGEYNVNNEL